MTLSVLDKPPLCLTSGGEDRGMPASQESTRMGSQWFRHQPDPSDFALWWVQGMGRRCQNPPPSSSFHGGEGCHAWSGQRYPSEAKPPFRREGLFLLLWWWSSAWGLQTPRGRQRRSRVGCFPRTVQVRGARLCSQPSPDTPGKCQRVGKAGEERRTTTV